MNIDLNENQLLDIILYKTKNNEPYAITRIGDGELLISENDINNHMTSHMYKRHLGYIPSEEVRNEITKNVIYSIINSDVLSLRNDYTKPSLIVWSRVPELYKSLDNKNLLGVKNYCNHDVHFKFGQKGLFDKLFKSIEHLTLITCRDVKSQIETKYPNIKTIKLYKIPGEFMFEDEKKIEPYFPNIFDSIKEDIEKNDNRGNLLLLGGGFVGKQLGISFKKSGGVSFDIGSMFDMWIGKITRGEGRGPNTYSKPSL
jgi:hypothetical protein